MYLNKYFIEPLDYTIQHWYGPDICLTISCYMEQHVCCLNWPQTSQQHYLNLLFDKHEPHYNQLTPHSEIFWEFFRTLVIDHARAFRVSNTTRNMHHVVAYKQIKLQVFIFIWNFGWDKFFYILRIINFVIGMQKHAYMCMGQSTFLKFNYVNNCTWQVVVDYISYWIPI